MHSGGQTGQADALIACEGRRLIQPVRERPDAPRRMLFRRGRAQQHVEADAAAVEERKCLRRKLATTQGVVASKAMALRPE